MTLNNMLVIITQIHCLKDVRIRSFSDPYFPAFGLNTERCGVPLRIQCKCGKTRTRKTPNMNTFHAVIACDFENMIYEGLCLLSRWVRKSPLDEKDFIVWLPTFKFIFLKSLRLGIVYYTLSHFWNVCTCL